MSLNQVLTNLTCEVGFTYKLDPPLFNVGDIVVEKYSYSRSIIPMKVVNVIFPERDHKSRYWDSYSYKIKAALFDDQGTYLDNKVFPESLLLNYSDRKDEIIGEMMSRLQDLQELK